MRQSMLSKTGILLILFTNFDFFLLPPYLSCSSVTKELCNSAVLGSALSKLMPFDFRQVQYIQNITSVSNRGIDVGYL